MTTDLFILALGIAIALATPFIPAIMGKYLYPRYGIDVREDALEHAVIPEFSSSFSEAEKNTILHGHAYPHGGVMDKTTRKLIAQRKHSNN